jgi:transcriptional regulator with XRE-family HTH domain
MDSVGGGGALLRQVRVKAGLTQRELAARAGTAQSVVARVELGQTSPAVSTLRRLLAAAGFELEMLAQPAPVLDPQVLDDVPRIKLLKPEQRLLEVANLNRFVLNARRVR